VREIVIEGIGPVSGGEVQSSERSGKKVVARVACRGQDSRCHIAAETCIASATDFAHAARTQPSHTFVGTKKTVFDERHRQKRRVWGLLTARNYSGNCDFELSSRSLLMLNRDSNRIDKGNAPPKRALVQSYSSSGYGIGMVADFFAVWAFHAETAAGIREATITTAMT
jgi:hypothetical protein